MPCNFGAALGFNSQCICIVAGETIFGGDDIGADALGDEIGVHRNRRISGNRSTVRPHRDAAHHLNTTGNISTACAAFDLVGTKVNSLHARCAETVDRKTRDGLIQIRSQNGRTGQTAALFHNLGHVAPNHILNRMAA